MRPPLHKLRLIHLPDSIGGFWFLMGKRFALLICILGPNELLRDAISEISSSGAAMMCRLTNWPLLWTTRL